MEHSAEMLGTFERNVGGVFVYRTSGGYTFWHAQGMARVGMMPASFNVWQVQLRVWLLARGWA